MQINLEHAILKAVQVKPPKEAGDPPIMRVIVETEGVAGIDRLARHVDKRVGVVVDTLQLGFEDLPRSESRETRIAQTS